MRFVDTSFWIALHYPRDHHFGAAQQLWRQNRLPLLTTNLVVSEAWTFLRRREGHTRAVHFLNSIVHSLRIVVVRIDSDVEQVAWDWLRRHDERVYSFVDATSFATMRTLGILEAFAFDGDFSAAGFVEVRP